MKDEDWQKVVQFLKKAFEEDHQSNALKLLLTIDEREALSTRIKIIEALLEGSVNQRQLKDSLGIGIATVTRGSNSLKEISPQFKLWLEKVLLNH